MESTEQKSNLLTNVLIAGAVAFVSTMAYRFVTSKQPAKVKGKGESGKLNIQPIKEPVKILEPIKEVVITQQTNTNAPSLAHPQPNNPSKPENASGTCGSGFCSMNGNDVKIGKKLSPEKLAQIEKDRATKKSILQRMDQIKAEASKLQRNAQTHEKRLSYSNEYSFLKARLQYF